MGTIQLQVPGRHNLANALATVAVGLELGLPFTDIARGLGEFRGAERRFEVRAVESHGVVGYHGHHPTEIAAVLTARGRSIGASSWRSSRIATAEPRRCSTRSDRRWPPPITSC